MRTFRAERACGPLSCGTDLIRNSTQIVVSFNIYVQQDTNRRPTKRLRRNRSEQIGFSGSFIPTGGQSYDSKWGIFVSIWYQRG